jgi:hypothetical protein
METETLNRWSFAANITAVDNENVVYSHTVKLPGYFFGSETAANNLISKLLTMYANTMPIAKVDISKICYEEVTLETVEQMNELIGHSNVVMAALVILADSVMKDFRKTNEKSEMTSEMLVTLAIKEAEKMLSKKPVENLVEKPVETKQPRSAFTLEELREGLIVKQ